MLFQIQSGFNITLNFSDLRIEVENIDLSY